MKGGTSPKASSTIYAKAFDRLRKLRAIGLRQNTDGVVDKSGIDGYELHKSGGRRLGETDLGPSLERNIELITRFMRRDPGQQKIG